MKVISVSRNKDGDIRSVGVEFRWTTTPPPELDDIPTFKTESATLYTREGVRQIVEEVVDD